MTPVLLVSGDFVRTGGMDRANFALANYLARTGTHEVHLVAHRVDDELQRASTVTFHRVAKPLNSYLLGGPLLAKRGKRLAREIAARGGRVIVNGGNCIFGDVNWVHYVHAAWTPPPSRASLPRRIKDRLRRSQVLKQEAVALRQARLALTNSNRTSRDVIDRLGVSSDRVRTLYLGVDPTVFHPVSADRRSELRKQLGWPDARPTVAFIGGLGDRRKGFDSLFEAWRALCAQPSWDADLAVIGHGADLPAWKQRAEEAGLANRIRFMGFRRDVPDLLRACDAMVAPARYEPYGLGVHEALCCGLPALVSRGAGIAERYPAALADLLIPDPDDVADLAKRLSAWREKREHYRTLVSPLAQTLRAYTWDDMARDFVAAMDDKVRDHSPRPTVV